MNVILITLDGFRLDRVKLCSSITSIFSNNLFFSNMVTAAPYTIASMHAIYSGIYPSKNGVNSYFNMFRYKSTCKSLAQYLKQEGYTCVADIYNHSVVPKAGFDTIHEHHDKEQLIPRHKKMISDISSTNRFFLYLHNTSVHRNVINNVAKKYDDFNDEYFNNKDKFSSDYNSYLSEYDNYVKEIMEHITSLGLSSNTLVIFHSDHGCSVGDRKGERMYGIFTYDYSISTFCTFIFPNNRYVRKVNYQCNTVDILPTILDILGIKQDITFDKVDGKSLMSFANGTELKDRLSFSETGGLFGPWPSHKEHNVFCIRYNNKKIVYNKTPKTWEFYDLISDPQEKNNLADTSSEFLEYKKMLLSKLDELTISI